MTTDHYACEGREFGGHWDPWGADRHTHTPSPAAQWRHVTNPLQTGTTSHVVVWGRKAQCPSWHQKLSFGRLFYPPLTLTCCPRSPPADIHRGDTSDGHVKNGIRIETYTSVGHLAPDDSSVCCTVPHISEDISFLTLFFKEELSEKCRLLPKSVDMPIFLRRELVLIL